MKINFISNKTILEVSKMIKEAKSKGLIKPHTEVFDKNLVKLESHKGNINYFKNLRNFQSYVV